MWQEGNRWEKGWGLHKGASVQARSVHPLWLEEAVNSASASFPLACDIRVSRCGAGVRIKDDVCQLQRGMPGRG